MDRTYLETIKDATNSTCKGLIITSYFSRVYHIVYQSAFWNDYIDWTKVKNLSQLSFNVAVNAYTYNYTMR